MTGEPQILDSTRGITIPDGLDIGELISWGGRLWARCPINGYVCRAEGTWMKVTITPLKIKGAKKDSEAVLDSSSEAAAPEDGPPPPENTA